MDVQVDREYSNGYDGIKVKVVRIEGDQIVFVCHDKASIQKGFGNSAPEVEEMLGVEESLHVKEFEKHYSKLSLGSQ